VSREGTERLMEAAIDFALTNKSKSVTLVHKGAPSVRCCMRQRV
jgi:isocitrate dehydrogenase